MLKEKTSIYKSFVFFIIAELFFMIFAATELMSIKFVLLVGIIAHIIILSFRERGLSYNKNITIWILIYVVIGVIPIIVGVINGNPNPTTGIVVTAIEPLIFWFIMSYIDIQMFKDIKKAIPYITMVLYLYIIFCFFCLNGYIFSSIKLHIFFFDINRGGTQFASFSPIYGSPVTWLYFLVPVNIMKFFYGRTGINDKQWWLTKLNVILGITCTICILKTALILTVIFSFFFAPLIISYRNKLKLKINTNSFWGLILCAIVFVVIFWIFHIEMRNMLYLVIQKVKVSFGLMKEVNRYGIVDGGSSVRVTEVRFLLKAWLERPLFGWGSGIGIAEITRSINAGDYEMTFFSRLMQSGLILVVVREFLIGWLYINMLKIIKSDSWLSNSAACIMAGLTGMLFANFTNPFLESFDRIVILFLPLLIYRLYIVDLSYNRVHVKKCHLDIRN